MCQRWDDHGFNCRALFCCCSWIKTCTQGVSYITNWIWKSPSKTFISIKIFFFLFLSLNLFTYSCQVVWLVGCEMFERNLSSSDIQSSDFQVIHWPLRLWVYWLTDVSMLIGRASMFNMEKHLWEMTLMVENGESLEYLLLIYSWLLPGGILSVITQSFYRCWCFSNCHLSLHTDLESGIQQHIQLLQELSRPSTHQGHVQTAGLPGHRRGDGGTA